MSLSMLCDDLIPSFFRIEEGDKEAFRWLNTNRNNSKGECLCLLEHHQPFSIPQKQKSKTMQSRPGGKSKFSSLSQRPTSYWKGPHSFGKEGPTSDIQSTGIYS